MAEQMGVVLQNERDGQVRVLTERKGACGGCHSTPGGCAGCLSHAKMESLVRNPVGAQVGDLVRISLPAASLFKGAALLYLLPVATLILGAVGGSWIAKASDGANLGSIGGGLVGLVAGFLLVAALGRTRRLRNLMTPTITTVVKVPQRLIPKHQGACCD
jgi:sigma-E factor negative regulatory protein RseC